MKVNKIKSAFIVGVMLSLFVASSFAVQPAKTDAIDPFFTLVFKTNGGGVRPDYGNFLRQHLARIGIDVEVVVQDWPTFVMELIAFRDFDICYVGLTGGGADPDFTGVYDENGSLNLFGYHTSMDWSEEKGTGMNEWYMRQGTLIMPPDSEARVQHYWDWEQYFMDKICALAPTFAPKSYVALWSNLVGYNMSDGTGQSWGKMYFDGSHTGQISTDELVITNAAWSDLNPLFQDDTSSSFISNRVLDPLIFYDADLSVWPHLAESYTYLDDTTIEIVCRDGIKWGADPDANFLNEYFDAEDVYFTIQAWKTVSNEPYTWDWVESMEMTDDMTLIINVDADPDVAGQQAYAPSLPTLSTRILPEHYLNQTQLADGVTPDISHPSWSTFATDAFGTNLFEISDFTEGTETVLTVKSDCWKLDETITSDIALNWVERFGFDTTWDTNGMHNLRIRIIPDQQTALLEFEIGKVDLISTANSPTKIDEFQQDTRFSVQSDTTNSFGFFALNMREVRPVIGSREPCPNDPEMSIGLAVRKAISYATNRYEMNDVIHAGEFFVTDWPISPKLGLWCNPNIIRYNYNLEQAYYYMEKAGFNLTNPPIIHWNDSILNFLNTWWPTLIGITLGTPVIILVTIGSFKLIKRRRYGRTSRRELKESKLYYQDKL